MMVRIKFRLNKKMEPQSIEVWKMYLSNSYISIGFSGRGPNFEVSLTLESVIGKEKFLRSLILRWTDYHTFWLFFKKTELQQTKISYS